MPSVRNILRRRISAPPLPESRKVYSVFDPFLGPVDITEDEIRVSAVGIVDLTQEPG